MSEEELNEGIIKNKIQGICQDCIHLDKIIPIINQLLKETYIEGLKQGEFDKETGKQQLISFLEDKIKELEEKINGLNYNEIEYYDQVKIDIYQEVLDFINKGVKNEQY